MRFSALKTSKAIPTSIILRFFSPQISLMIHGSSFSNLAGSLVFYITRFTLSNVSVPSFLRKNSLMSIGRFGELGTLLSILSGKLKVLDVRIVDKASCLLGLGRGRFAWIVLCTR